MKKLALLMLAVFVVVLNASNVYPCVCGKLSQRVAFRKSHAVFIGQFFAFDEVSTIKDGRAPIKFKVEKMWKGKKSDEIIVYTDDLLRSACGDGFVLGRKYLVYAYGKDLVARTTCDLSGELPANFRYEDYKDRWKELQNLDSRWFRFISRVWPFAFP